MALLAHEGTGHHASPGPKVCKYGHVRDPGDTYCKECSAIRSAARRKRVDANWKAPVYTELATKPWLVCS